MGAERQLRNAAEKGKLDKVGRLLNQGVNVNATDWCGRTPLHFASKNKNQQVAQLLIDNRADMKIRNNDGNTPLHCACGIHGNFNMAKLLVENDADVNATDKYGRTPLHLAIKWRHKDITKLLLENDADVNATDKYGRTPLHLATKWRHKDIAELLVEGGANISARNEKGKTPLMKAREHNLVEFVSLLERAQQEEPAQAENEQDIVAEAAAEREADPGSSHIGASRPRECLSLKEEEKSEEEKREEEDRSESFAEEASEGDMEAEGQATIREELDRHRSSVEDVQLQGNRERVASPDERGNVEFPIAREFPYALTDHDMTLLIDGKKTDQKFYLLQVPVLAHLFAYEHKKDLPVLSNVRERGGDVAKCQRWSLIHSQRDGNFHAQREGGERFVVVKKVPKAEPKDRGSDNDPYKEVAAMRFLNPFGNDHNTAACLEALENEKFVFIVTPYAKPLNELLDERHKMPEKQLLDVFGKVVANVQFMHKRNVCHLDLKPGNILVNSDLTTTLIDLQSSQRFPKENGALPEGKLMINTPEYRAPEFSTGAAIDGRKADVWSLGVLYFYMLTGVLPVKKREHETDRIFPYFFEKDGLVNTNPYLIGGDPYLQEAAYQLDTLKIKGVRELLRDMMKPEPKDRMSLEDVQQRLQDIWKGLDNRTSFESAQDTDLN